MRQLTTQDISLKKAVLRVALIREVIDQRFYDKEMKKLNDLEENLLKEKRRKAINTHDLQGKLHTLASH